MHRIPHGALRQALALRPWPFTGFFWQLQSVLHGLHDAVHDAVQCRRIVRALDGGSWFMPRADADWVLCSEERCSLVYWCLIPPVALPARHFRNARPLGSFVGFVVFT